MTKPNDTGFRDVSLQVVGTKLCFGMLSMGYKEIVKESFKDLEKPELNKILKEIDNSKSVLDEMADIENDTIDDEEPNEKENDEKKI